MTTRTMQGGREVRVRRVRRGAALLAAGVLALPACDILDVENPNNVVEESIHLPTAAAAVVNGALALTSEAISAIWQPYLVASDELTWIGSRDAWQALDFGYVSDHFNEFTDLAFPSLGRARWMADRAVEIMNAHVDTLPTDDMKFQQARAYFASGLIYMIIGEVQEDFAFSDKREPAPPVGPENMFQVLDTAIARLDRAAAIAQELGEADLETRVLAVRARAKHSRAIWDKIKPTPNTAAPLVSSPGATQDAQAVLARVPEDWTYKITFSAATITNDMAAWINDRAENQIDLNIVEVDPGAVKQITGIKLRDPIDDVQDPVITAKVTEWKNGDITATGTQYPPLTIASARMMHLILAEAALAGGDDAGFATHINHIRSLDIVQPPDPQEDPRPLTPYSGQIPALDMLIHERRVNLFLMGLRLKDMYRFGIQDPLWQAGSHVVTRPGSLLPITIVERRANPHIPE